LIFAPIIILLIQVIVIRVVGIKFARLTWSLAVLLAFLTIIGIIFLIPFLPLQSTIETWKPFEYFNTSLRYEMLKYQWISILMVLALYFSAIVYHPGERHTEKVFKPGLYAVTAAASMAVILSDNLYTVITGLVFFDTIELLSNFQWENGKPHFVLPRQEIFPRSLSILMILASYIFHRNSIIVSEHYLIYKNTGALLLLSAVIIRIMFHISSNFKDKPKRKHNTYNYLINVGTSLSILQLDIFTTSGILDNGVLLVIGLVVLMSQLPGILSRVKKFEFYQSFSIYIVGANLILIHLTPSYTEKIILYSIVVILCGAGAIFLQPFFEDRHRIPVIIFASLLVGIPFTPSALWSGIWGGLIKETGSLFLIILLPLINALPVFKIINFLEIETESWSGTEVITRALFKAGPVVPLLSTAAISVWSGDFDKGWQSWLFILMVTGVVLGLIRIKDKVDVIIENLKRMLPKTRSEQVIEVPIKIESMVQHSLSEAEHFLEGESSFLWVLLVLIVIALINRR